MVVLNDDELCKRICEKVERGSAVVVFANGDDADNIAGFLGAVTVGYGVDIPLDLSFFVLDEENVSMSEEKRERVCKHLQSILFNFDDGCALRHYLAFSYLADICPDLTISEARDLIEQIDAEMKEIPF